MEKDGVQHKVTRSSFETIYRQSGWNLVEDESATQTNESTLENAGTPPNSGHRSAGKRGGARRRN